MLALALSSSSGSLTGISSAVMVIRHPGSGRTMGAAAAGTMVYWKKSGRKPAMMVGKRL